MGGSDAFRDLLRLDCPFHARSPEKYKKCRSCNGAGFPNLSRLKDHLKTVHSSTCLKCPSLSEDDTTDVRSQRRLACKHRREVTIEYMTEEQSEALKNLPRRSRGMDRGAHWRLIFSKLFGNKIPIPPPYLPSLDQYRQVGERPTAALLSALEEKVLTSGRAIPFHVDETLLRFCLGLMPTVFELVSEKGLLPQDTHPPAPLEERLFATTTGLHQEEHYFNFDMDDGEGDLDVDTMLY